MAGSGEWSLGVVDLPLWSIVLALGVFALFAVSRKSRNLPPGPPPLPVVGNLNIFANSKCLHRDLAKLAGKYGEIMWLWLGSKGAMVVSSPALAREVLKNQDAVFASRSPTHAATKLTFTNIAFAPYGPALRHSKKVMIAELVSPKMLKQFEDIRSQEIAAMVATIRSHITTSGAERSSPVNIAFLLNLLTLNNITRMGISKKFFDYQIQDHTGPQTQSTSLPHQGNEDSESFVSLVNEVFTVLPIQLLRDCIPYLSIFDNLNPVKHRISTISKRLDRFLTALIQEHREELRQDSRPSAKDYVDVLLQLNDEDKLSDDAVKGQVLDLILGGSHTTASTTQWAMVELLRHPDYLERVEKEVNSAVSSDRQVTDADLPKLPYLEAVVKETLRLHPVVPLLIPHCSLEATKVAGYDIPAQTAVFVNVWAITTDPAVWKDSLQFIPERFIDRPDLDVRGQTFEVLPFGSGRRICPGTNLGLLMVQLILATLLHEFRWSLPDDVKKPDDLDMTEKEGLAVTRVEPLHVVFDIRHA